MSVRADLAAARREYEGGGATKYGGFGSCGDTSRGVLRVATLLERDDLLQQYRNLDWKSKQNRGFGEVVGGECGRVSGNNVIDATLLVVYLHKKVVIAWEGLGW